MGRSRSLPPERDLLIATSDLALLLVLRLRMGLVDVVFRSASGGKFVGSGEAALELWPVRAFLVCGCA